MSITYEDGHGVLREVMNTIGNHGVAVDHLDVLSVPDRDPGVALQRVRIEMHTIGGSLTQLLRELAEIPRVRGVDSARGTDEDG